MEALLTLVKNRMEIYMDKEYKLVLSNGKFYKEIILKEDIRQLYIGTIDGCDVLLDKDIFASSFCFLIYLNQQNSWEINCDDNIYIAEESIVKQITRSLVHGDDVKIKYQHNNKPALNLNFVINFEQNQQDYRKIIEIDGYSKHSISVGGNDNYDICIYDELMHDSEFYIRIEKNGIYVDNIRCRYGLYINGNIVKEKMEIKDCDFISVLGCSFYYRDHTLRTTENSKISVQGLPCKIEQISAGNMLYPKFYRNTRIIEQPNKSEIKVLAPPNEVSKPEKNILKNILPAIGTLVLTIVIRGVISGGGTYILFSVCTMGMGIGTTIASFIGDKKAYKKNKKEREEKYERYIDKKRDEIELCRQEEKDYLDKLYVSGYQEYKQVMDFSSELFRCKSGDFDYLNIRLGVGKIKSERTIDYKEVEQLEIEDELVVVPEKIANEYEFIEDAPIICNLEDVNSLGIVGDDFHTKDLLKNIIVDICTRHYHTDVKIIIIASEKDEEYINWTRYLPHINMDNMRLMICDEESKNSVFEFMYKVFSEREESKSKFPNYVVFVLNDMGIKQHPVSRYIQKAGDYGFSFVFFERHEERLPIGCKKIIRLTNNKREGVLLDSNNGGEELCFEYTTLSDEYVNEIAFKLAPVYTEEVSLESSLVKNITLFELLDINNVSKLNLQERWNNSCTEKSLAAPLGLNSKKEIVYLDLHEKYHGPHGLVAGTTGSGKSEILQSYILSVATLYHPHEVSFMIIDFKGGGMVNQFRKLPHLIGAITNIDGKEINRSLKSIKAELKKRQRCFADAEVNHIDAYIGKYKNGEVTEIIPHLIVIVDEFAELKAEQPEFMKELISAARIGRSLGVHLILATQKPAGQVNEQIWSNSKFKLCLKVQNKEDSNEVLKSPLAAEIKEPGRAYLQVGNNEIFELFQSAYSGAPAEYSVENEKKEFYVAKVALNGKREIVYQYKKKKQEGEIVTQLNAIVNYISEYCSMNGIKKVPDICLPSLPEIVDFNGRLTEDKNYLAPIGIYDDPDSQYQGYAYLDMVQNNTAVIGSSQFGKTNFLQQIIRYYTTVFSPKEFNFYVLDFASRFLTIFDEIKHCGGVVCPGEDEKFKNLIKYINYEIAKRKEKFLKCGVTSYGSYLEGGNTDVPIIMILIDNFTALKELYLNEKDVLVNICREGATLGISVVVANSTTSGFGYRYLSNFTNKLAFYCNDQNEYNSLFEYCRERPSVVPGRCLIEIQKKRHECQSMLSFKGEKEIERVAEMKKFISTINGLYPDIQATRIPMIPKTLYADALYKNIKDTYSYPVGVDYGEVMPIEINIKKDTMLTVIGRDNSGRSNFIKTFLYYIGKKSRQFKVSIIDGIDRKLENYKGSSYVDTYSIIHEDVKVIIDKTHSELSQRYNLLIESGGKCDMNFPVLIMIINNIDAINLISSDRDTLLKYKEIVDRFKSLGVFILFSQIPNAPISYNASEVIKGIKDSKHFIIFEDINQIKVSEINMLTIKEFKKPIELGDAYYFKGTNVKKIKTAII